MKQNFVVTYDAEGAGLTLDLEIDAERTGSSTPPTGSTVWVKAWTDLDIVIKGATRGNVQIDKTHMREEITETLYFEDTDKATLRRAPVTVKSQEWLGAGLGSHTIDKKDIKATTSGHGVLKIVYEAAYALLTLAGVNVDGPVIMWAQDSSGAEGDLRLDFGAGDTAIRDCYIVERDFCTDLPLAAASVWIDEQLKGTTGADGRLYIGKYVQGTRHTHRASKAGYKDSDVDALANDEFEVP